MINKIKKHQNIFFQKYSSSKQVPVHNDTEQTNSLVSNAVLIPITQGSTVLKLLFTPTELDPQHLSNTLDNWQIDLLKTLGSTHETQVQIQAENKSEFVRLVKSFSLNTECGVCQLFEFQQPNEMKGVVFFSIDAAQYYAKSYAHVWNMVVNIAVIWLLGLLAIIYGYKKTRAAIINKLKNYEESVFSLVDIIEKRDSYTAGHTQRVAHYALLIAKELNLSRYEKYTLYRAAMLHDIGKISTPDSILLKPGKLSHLEYKIIQMHVTTSFEILSKVSIYQDIAEVVRHHHEYYDGSGYPQGLKGGEIPFLSQILTVADGFDAMTTDRIYKARKTIQTALEEISALSGRQFNPVIVKSAVKALSNVQAEKRVTQLPESDLQHERFSYFYKDNVTHVYNKHYFNLLLSKQKSELSQYRYALMVKLHNFTQYNAEHGWIKGDEKLTEIAARLQQTEENHLVFRLFGDDFVLLLQEKLTAVIKNMLLHKEIEDTCLNYSMNYVDLQKNKLMSVEELERIM